MNKKIVQDWSKLVERQKSRKEHPGTPSVSQEVVVCR